MSPDTRWFHDDTVLRNLRTDERMERTTIFPLILWVLVIAGVLFLATGCASEPSKSPRSEVCMVQVLGQSSDTGLPVVAMSCVSPEEFAKSQQ